MENIILQAENFVLQLFETKLSANNFYHNIDHTKRVVKRITQLAEWEGCNEREKEILELTAWFHDTGYVVTNDGHEEESAKIAEEFLTSNQFSLSDIALVKKLIFVTKKGAVPITKLEKIAKDADCSHLASDDYFEISNLLKKEIVLKNNTPILDLDWLEANKEFFENQQFYTQSALLKWQPYKELNARELDAKILKIKTKQQVKLNNKRTGRGVETMFRTTLKNHIELSAIADTKANILLSVNAIIISVALSSLVPRLDSPSNAFLVWPTLILTVLSVISIVLSVLSTRPNISKITVTKDMIKNKQTNILFFGNFYKMNLKDFEWGIDYLIENEDVLYNSLTKDLYYLGLVLERKYRLLRITYTVFMFGIIISALAFIISYYLFMIN
ncbi:phosphohydrolase [Pseudalgibacter alginicilyticus]|uniref:Phosphohydrolase n=1 Tax=Pseudalgibacter alginicilyticus TaxID=1736674 RepID=A0A0P0D640_9FLAO|nr:Pycsar system effector family protein [Pseudalgibacter alginicilyticus]ALJ04149.1 phosphohydrolase [Pseudalgibacter alginicilyticus]